MLVTIDRKLLAEAERFALRSSCQDCLYFLAASERCGHGWPNEHQKRALFARAGESGKAPAFCKEFELR